MKMLDLSKFEKVSEYKQKTTMRHKDGHEMTILMSALPKIHREQLKRLKMAEGGKVTHYDDGTPDAPVSQDDASSQQAPDKSITINVGTPATQAQDIPGTTPVQAAPAPAQAPVQPGSMAVNPANPAVSLAESKPYVNVPEVPKTPPNVNPVTGTMNPAAVSKNTQTAAQLQGEINAAKAQGAKGVEGNYIAGAATAAQTDQNNLADIKGHTDQFAQYIQNNPIDPNHWAESQKSGQKVANAIGLLAGGFTGGFNGTGNNPALNFINTQIDRDIAAQKARGDQQRTVLGAYQALYGDSVAANAAAKASMLDIYNHQFNQIAAQLGTPQAAQNAMAFSAQAAVEKSTLLQKAALDLRNQPGYHPLPQQQGLNVTGGQMPGQVGKGILQPGGASSSWSQEPGANPNGKQFNQSKPVTTYPILKPGAIDIASGLHNVGNLSHPEFEDQIRYANQLESVLNGPKNDGVGGIHDILQDMHHDIKKGSLRGLDIGAGEALKSVPIIGSALESAWANTGDETYNDFMRKAGTLSSDIYSALGGKVAYDQIARIVNSNLPKISDTDESLKTAETQIVNSALKAMPHDQLIAAKILDPNGPLSQSKKHREPGR